MKSLIKNSIHLTLLTLLLHSFALLAKDYFVSPSGNDASGNGTIGSPWKTLAYAIPQCYPGDVLYLRAGEYHEQMFSARSGTPIAYITISTYNDEDAYIDGQGVTSGNNGCLLSHSYMKFRGFTVRNWQHDGMAFSNCWFIELKKIKVTAVTGCISMKNTVHDFVLDSCIMYDYYGGAGGLGFDATPEGATDRIYNGVIKNCKAYLTAGAFDNCDGFALGHEGVSDIYLYNCEAYGVGDAFDISGKNIVLERCSAHDATYGGGYKIWFESATLINCIGYGSETNVELDYNDEAGLGTSVKLINCTFYTCCTSNIGIQRADSGKSLLEVYNCIIAGGNNTGITFDGDSIKCYKGNYNLFHMNAPERAFATSQLDYSLSQIQNGEWTLASAQDANSKIVFDASTLFRDTTMYKPNLHLKMGALAIDNGFLVQGAPTRDFDNFQRQDGRIDIGAYEYAAGTGLDDANIGDPTKDVTLGQSFPNPISASDRQATIKYTLPVKSTVRLSVVDLRGNEVAVLVDESKEQGSYQAHFNTAQLPGGVYYYVLQTSASSRSKRIVVLK